MDDIKPQGVFSAPNQPNAQARSPIVSSRKRKFYKQRWFRNLIILFVILGLGGWGWFANAAEVTVVLKTQEEDFTHEFSVNSDPLADFSSEANVIPGEIIEKTAKDSRQFPSTGTVTTGAKASGSASFYNQCPSPAVTVAANTQVFYTGTSPNRAFRTKSSVTFNPMETKSISLEAEAIGPEYNISGSEDWKVTGNTCINGDGSTDGGTSGGTRVSKKGPSQTDVDNAKKVVSDELLDKTKKTWVDELPDGQTFLGELVYPEKTTQTANPDVGGEGDNFTVEVTLELRALVFEKEALNGLLERKLDVGESKKVDEIKNPTFVVLLFDKDGGTAKLNAKGKAIVVADYTEDILKDLVAGKNSNNIVKELRGKDGVANVTVKSKPGFLSMLPKRKEKITVVFEKE